MDNFDLRKYLAEGKLLKEDLVDFEGNDMYQEIKGDMKRYYKMDVSMDVIKDWADYYFPNRKDEDGIEYEFETSAREDFLDHLEDIKDSNTSDEDKELQKQVDIQAKSARRVTSRTRDLAMAKGLSMDDYFDSIDEGKLLKEELTWYVEDENEDIRFQNDEYLKEVGKKIKEIHPDISSEDLNKIIIMTGEQYSREEDFHGDSIPSGNFVKAAVEIYQTDVLGSDGEDDEDFDEWAPENLDGDFPKDSIFAGWTQAQYDAYQEEPRKYRKYLGGGSFELS